MVGTDIKTPLKVQKLILITVTYLLGTWNLDVSVRSHPKPGLYTFRRGWLTEQQTFRSSHDSPKYGQWYTAEEVVELFAPAPHRVDAVRGWLEQSGVAPERISLSANKQWLQFDAEAREAGDLFKTTYHVYEHTANGGMAVATDE